VQLKLFMSSTDPVTAYTLTRQWLVHVRRCRRCLTIGLHTTRRFFHSTVLLPPG